MSKDWVNDIIVMHEHYNINKAVKKLNKEDLRKFFEFRIAFLKEELKELEESTTSDDAIDALIDLVVVAIGTLEAFQVNQYDAWDRVLVANMSKKTGIKESRPNPLGLPDLIKPEGWQAPSHSSNLSLFDKIF